MNDAMDGKRAVKLGKEEVQKRLADGSAYLDVVVKGHWIMTSDYLTTAYGSIDYVKCSCCGEDSLEEGNYCSNCGADMREDGVDATEN